MCVELNREAIELNETIMQRIQYKMLQWSGH
jgi:hypothetical protein